VFFGFSRCVTLALWQQALRASPLCPAVFRLRVAVRLCSNVLRAYSSFCRCIGCAHAPRHQRFARLGGLTVRSSRHRFTAANFFGMLRFLVAAVQRCGLTQVLGLLANFSRHRCNCRLTPQCLCCSAQLGLRLCQSSQSTQRHFTPPFIYPISRTNPCRNRRHQFFS